jgi:uncharacterized repeat protein (TIGR03803 family)
MLCAISGSAQAQTITILHSFSGGEDESSPTGLTMDSGGNLYGVTTPYEAGTVFQVKRTGSGWRFTTLYRFAGGADGAQPSSRVTIGPDGGLYGTTAFGGGYQNCDHGRETCGTVYKLSPPPRACATVLCPWTETILYRFTGRADGASPAGALVFDRAGNIYGTAGAGGNLVTCGDGCGVVFKLTPSNGSWTESVLYNFTGVPDGMEPTSGVIFDNSGNLYGTTFLGGIEGGFWGVYGNGTVFELSPSESGWTEKILCQFQGGCEGANPQGGLIIDSAGNLFGTTFQTPTAFMLTPSGGNWNYSLLRAFSYSGDGPEDSLFRDAAGNLYGTTSSDGAYYYGTVFELTPSGGGWTYTDLHDFSGAPDDGAQPGGNVIRDANGNLYGTTTRGGANDLGVVFEITP